MATAVSSAAASYASPGVGIQHSVLANASAYANLATGKIGAASTSTNYGTTVASAAFEDTLNFNIAGADAATVTPIVFNLLYHGTIYPSYGSVIADLLFYADQRRENGIFYGGSVLAINRSKGSGNSQNTYYSQLQDFGWLSYSAIPNGSGDTYTISATFGLIGASPTLKVRQILNLSTNQEANADFLHTASLLLSVPDNVTYSSASGVFLSQASTAVPEPSTWAMLIVGFGLVGGAARRSVRRERVA